MKPNEIPEKIYLSAIDLEEVGHFLTEANDRDDVEYVRADVFINNACKWLFNAFHKNHDGTFNYVGGNDCSIEDIINVFKKAQKEE